MDGNTTDRLSQKSERRDEKVNSILEDAAEISGRVLSSIQALAGTTACKGVQIARLKEWALNNVLMGIDGHLYFIDTIIYKSDTGGFDTYRSLSPNYSPKTFGNLNENP